MYEEHFGLKEKPFSLLPDPSFLFLSKQHSTAYTMLEYGLMSKAPIIVVTGEIGGGKTTLLRHLLNHTGDDLTLGLISNTHESFGGLMQWVMVAFDIQTDATTDAQRFKAFTDFLIAQYREGKRTVLIVDEAQNMSITGLEELRLLSNINADKHEVLQLVLVGQPELRESLQRPELKQFVQRIAVAYHLGPLSEVEAYNYIEHRLTTAGAPSMLFTEEAVSRIFKYSQGVPRIINVVCDTAMVYAFAQQLDMISDTVVEEVIQDRASTGLFSDPDSAITTYAPPQK